MNKLKTFLFPIGCDVVPDVVINEFIKDNKYKLINVSVSVDIRYYNLYYAVTYNDNTR